MALSPKQKWVLTFPWQRVGEQVQEGSWEMEVGGRKTAGSQSTASRKTGRDPGIKYLVQLGRGGS